MLPGGVELELVKLPNGIYMGKYEVTQGQWQALMKTTIHDMHKERKEKDSIYTRSVGPNYPMFFVNWYDAKVFCMKLNEDGYAPPGYKFSLPTETQWEYACRAGTTTDLNNGKNLTDNYKCPNADEVAWHIKNSWYSPKEVGGKKANNWGLYDMHGNVAEWCLEKHGNMAEHDLEEYNDIMRVVRGGDCLNYAESCRSSHRNYGNPMTCKARHVGFRVALVPVK